MSADAQKYHTTKTTKDDPHVVHPQAVSDPSLLDSVTGFLNEVVSNTTTLVDQIQWIRFEQAQFEELSYSHENNDGPFSSPPIFLVVGYSKGAQIWFISATGQATEIISWKNQNIKTLRILPSPFIASVSIYDLFENNRPMVALCEASSPNILSFFSLKTGQEVRQINFPNQVLDVYCNKSSVVVTFIEEIKVLDAFNLNERCTITRCYLSPGIQSNPIALGPRWLAFADKTLSQSKKSSGGMETDGIQSYTASVVTYAKSITQGIMNMGETMASSFTGSSVGTGSPQSGGTNDASQKGIITIVDLENHLIENKETANALEVTIAHFYAHSDAIVQLEFDKSGMLLLTADKNGHDFHVFRIHPHPFGSHFASVHHLYSLHRGDTTATIQSMCFSADSRWVAVSSSRGTTHVFPITPYGGNINKRTHTMKCVVNKLSRYHSSAGLSDEGRPISPVGTDCSAGAKMYPHTNPRLPPFPSPTFLSPLTQIKPMTGSQPTGTMAHTKATITRQRSSSSSGGVFSKVVACFSTSRSCIEDSEATNENESGYVEHLFVMNSTGLLLQYDLEPMPTNSVKPELVCDDTSIQLKVTPKAQWILQRRPNDEAVRLSLPEEYLEYFVPSDSYMNSSPSRDDQYWLSQVEILAHHGPHRRLWMGPQFVFKTYSGIPGVPFSISNIKSIDISHSKPINMPVTRNAVLIECGSASSRDVSPSAATTCQASVESIGAFDEKRLVQELAQAMLESSEGMAAGGHRVIASLKSQATPVAKVVNPLGTVVTIPSDEDIEQEEFEKPFIHENCDETLFRPIVVSEPIVGSIGKPQTIPIDIMLDESFEPASKVTVKLFEKSKSIPSRSLVINEECINDEKVKFPSEESNNSTNENIEFDKNIQERSQNRLKVSTPENISTQFDSFVLDENKYSTYQPNDIDCELIFDNYKADSGKETDFTDLNNKTEDKDAKTEMFEDATDCYDDLYANVKREIADKNEENITEDRITSTKPRKPKAKLGVRIPNKHFPVKKEEEVESVMPKRSWSSVAATKPKEKDVDISEKENCDMLDLTDVKGMKKSFNPCIKNVKLIHIETPVDEDAAIEIIEPMVPDSAWYSNVLDKSFSEEKVKKIKEPPLSNYAWYSNVLDNATEEFKMVDMSWETTESDDSGKLPENNIIADELILQNAVPAVTKASKKKSKKKRK